MSDIVKNILDIQDNLVKRDLGYISPEDAEFLRDMNNLPSNIEKGEPTPNESARAIRHDQGKPHMDLLSPIALFGTAQVLTKGLEKYPGSQWKKGMPWSKVTASVLRHLLKFMAGEDLDEESGLPHIDHVATNVMFLQEYFRKHKDLDDRMKTGLE